MKLEGSKKDWQNKIHDEQFKAGAEFWKAVGCGIVTICGAVGVIKHVFNSSGHAQMSLDLTTVTNRASDDDYEN